MWVLSFTLFAFMGSYRGGTGFRTGSGLKLITLMLIFLFILLFFFLPEGGWAAEAGLNAAPGEVCVLDPRDYTFEYVDQTEIKCHIYP